MSFLPCSYCERRNCGHLSHVYWFAPVRGSDVLRVRQRLCTECLAANLESLLTPPDVEALTCSACGISVEDDVYPIYVTWYPSRTTAERGAMALCEEHNLELRLRCAQGAVVLEDRFVDPPDQPLTQNVDARTAFASLGRRDPGLKHESQAAAARARGMAQRLSTDGA